MSERGPLALALALLFPLAKRGINRSAPSLLYRQSARPVATWIDEGLASGAIAGLIDIAMVEDIAAASANHLAAPDLDQVTGLEWRRRTGQGIGRPSRLARTEKLLLYEIPHFALIAINWLWTRYRTHRPSLLLRTTSDELLSYQIPPLALVAIYRWGWRRWRRRGWLRLCGTHGRVLGLVLLGKLLGPNAGYSAGFFHTEA